MEQPRQAGGASRLLAPWSRPRAGILLALALGVVGGIAANMVGLPLAWLLGPLLFCAGAAICGVPVGPLPWGREVGQGIVGLAIGSRLTGPVLASTIALLPAMVIVTLVVMLTSLLGALLLRPLAGVDRKTAFFATAAAGVAEMAILAHQRGADAEAVSICHAIRVGFIVTIVPLIVYHWGADGGIIDQGVAPTPGAEIRLALLAPFAAASAVLAKRLSIPNPWVMGPTFLAALVSGGGGLSLSVPWPLLVAAQIVIGVALGCRFQRALLARLPRVVGSALVISGLMVAAAAAGATGLSAATGLPYATSFLAIAPAGVTEMVLTARVMHLDTASITAFHLTRIALVTASAVVTFKLFERLSQALDRTGA